MPCLLREVSKLSASSQSHKLIFSGMYNTIIWGSKYEYQDQQHEIIQNQRDKNQTLNSEGKQKYHKLTRKPGVGIHTCNPSM